MRPPLPLSCKPGKFRLVQASDPGEPFRLQHGNVMERYKRPFVAHATAPVIWERGRKCVFGQGGSAKHRGSLGDARREAADV